MRPSEHSILDRTAAALRSRSSDIRLESHLPSRSSLARDVLEGLTRPVKRLPSKYLYDPRGAQLFDRILELPEYYPARLERALLQRHVDALVTQVGARELVELGCGSGTKTRLVLRAMHRAQLLESYVPIDVCGEVVRESSSRFATVYPWLRVHGIVADFERHLARVPRPASPRLVTFLGTTLGNLAPAARRRFLRATAGLLSQDSRLLVGVDLVKDEKTLIRAYDDAEGVTAEFNLNLLRVVNRELQADFDTGAFEHVALYDARREWIEMRLRSRRRQRVQVRRLHLAVDLREGEEIRTEISAKFTRERLVADLHAAGLALEGWHADEQDWYALALVRPAP